MSGDGNENCVTLGEVKSMVAERRLLGHCDVCILGLHLCGRGLAVLAHRGVSAAGGL